MSSNPTTGDPEIQIEIPTRRGPEPVTSAALHGVGQAPVESFVAVEQTMGEKSVCQAFVDWYLYPYKNILFSLKCTLYHFVSFFYMLLLWVYTLTYIPLSFGLVFLACFGVPLFYMFSELGIIFAVVDIAINYYLVENDPKQIAEGRPRLGYRALPECFDCKNRVKNVLCSAQTYKSLVYYLLIKPIVTFIASSCLIILIVEGGLLSLWIIVAARPEWFKYTNSSGVGVHKLWEALGVFAVAVLLLPLVLYVVIGAAVVSKRIAYFFLTNVYADNTDEEHRRLLVAGDRGMPSQTAGHQSGQDELVAV